MCHEYYTTSINRVCDCHISFKYIAGYPEFEFRANKLQTGCKSYYNGDVEMSNVRPRPVCLCAMTGVCVECTYIFDEPIYKEVAR